MQEVPKDLGQRILEAARLAVSEHLEQDAKAEMKGAGVVKPKVFVDPTPRLRGLVGDIVPGREAA